jgi:hypothetical protein
MRHRLPDDPADGGGGESSSSDDGDANGEAGERAQSTGKKKKGVPQTSVPTVGTDVFLIVVVVLIGSSRVVVMAAASVASNNNELTGPSNRRQKESCNT